MSTENQSQPRDGLTLRGTFNLVYLAAGGLATTLTPFLRTNFGSEALGFHGVAALVILLAYFSAYPSVGVAHFCAWWFVALISQRARTLWLHFRGEFIHSRYSGDPWLSLLVPRFRAEHARWLEPILCLVLAHYQAPHDPWLGQLLVWGSGGLFLRLLIDQLIDNKRVQRMRDAEIDQRYIVQRYARQRRRSPQR